MTFPVSFPFNSFRGLHLHPLPPPAWGWVSPHPAGAPVVFRSPPVVLYLWASPPAPQALSLSLSLNSFLVILLSS